MKNSSSFSSYSASSAFRKKRQNRVPQEKNTNVFLKGFQRAHGVETTTGGWNAGTGSCQSDQWTRSEAEGVSLSEEHGGPQESLTGAEPRRGEAGPVLASVDATARGRLPRPRGMASGDGGHRVTGKGRPAATAQ